MREMNLVDFLKEANISHNSRIRNTHRRNRLHARKQPLYSDNHHRKLRNLHRNLISRNRHKVNQAKIQRRLAKPFSKSNKKFRFNIGGQLLPSGRDYKRIDGHARRLKGTSDDDGIYTSYIDESDAFLDGKSSRTKKRAKKEEAHKAKQKLKTDLKYQLEKILNEQSKEFLNEYDRVLQESLKRQSRFRDVERGNVPPRTRPSIISRSMSSLASSASNVYDYFMGGIWPQKRKKFARPPVYDV